MTEAHPTEDHDLVAWARLRVANREWTINAERLNAFADEIERLREVVTIPLITPEAPPGFYLRVLTEHEKGQPVNAQDLINALMWRVKNQKREIARLNEALRRKASDEAPSFSPNFDERNGIR